MSSGNAWEKHYTSSKSILSYPDETLVRMLAPFLEGRAMKKPAAIDLGCGTGRHLKLLSELGAGSITGMDYSGNALAACRSRYSASLVQGSIMQLPFRSESFDIAIAWGSLHYTAKKHLPDMIGEILRVLKRGGRLFGTLRNSRDTYLKKGTHRGNDEWITDSRDIRSSLVSFYREDEVKDALSGFPSLSYGMMERTLAGDLSSVLSHWFFWAEKQ